MKKRYLLGILILCFLTLMGCSQFSSSLNENKPILTKEAWMTKVNTDPNLWIPKNINAWFFTGEPNSMKSYIQSAPLERATTFMSVNVPEFTKIRIDGDFQVQIVGMQDKNSIYIVGDNNAAREIVTEFKGKTIYIHPIPNSEVPLKKVIVRIGVRTLDTITNLGKATILGRQITSDHLKINNCDDGCIILNGQMNILKVTQLKSGKVIALGACSPNLNIDVQDNGTVNISGRVGVQSINNQNGQVHIIGADTNALKISASGNSMTTLYGYANLNSITANDHSCIYIYWVCSSDLTITESDSAKVGVAGNAATVNINLKNDARLGARYLYSQDVYIKTKDSAHANISTRHKLFSEASGDSSIYFYGSPKIISHYTAQSGLIVPLK